MCLAYKNDKRCDVKIFFSHFFRVLFSTLSFFSLWHVTPVIENVGPEPMGVAQIIFVEA